MQILQTSARGLSLLMILNWDRALFVGSIGAALSLGAWLAQI